MIHGSANNLRDATTLGNWSWRINFTSDDASLPFRGEIKLTPRTHPFLFWQKGEKSVNGEGNVEGVEGNVEGVADTSKLYEHK